MDKRIIKTKDNIKKTMIKLMLEKNFGDITVTEISNRANIGRKTFYLHYGSIIDVLKEMENELYKTFHNSINNISNTNYNIKNLFKDLNELINKDILFYKRMFINDSYSFFKNTIENLLSETIYDISTNIYKIKSKNCKIYTSYYAAGIIKLYTSYLKGELDISEDELIRICYRSTFLGASELLSNPL